MAGEFREGDFTSEEPGSEAGAEIETKPVPDIIGEDGRRTKLSIPPGEFWVTDKISHAEIEVPSNSGIRADIAEDTTFKTEPGAKIIIPEDSRKIEFIEHRTAA
ncbi:MAG: hypothetical protein ABH810_02635 [bacterium]